MRVNIENINNIVPMRPKRTVKLERNVREVTKAGKRKFEVTVRLAKLLLADPLDPRLARRFAAAVEAGDGSVVRRVVICTLES